MADCLSTTAQVMDALGGISAVAELTGSRYKAAANWKAFDTFPAKHFLVMTRELKRRGKVAPPSLWGMTEAERVS
jgi:hypothetical protein